MPTFLDHHAMGPSLPPEAKEGIADQIKAGTADQFGVRGLNVFLTGSGEAYCLSEAPDADAVVKSRSRRSCRREERWPIRLFTSR